MIQEFKLDEGNELENLEDPEKDPAMKAGLGEMEAYCVEMMALVEKMNKDVDRSSTPEEPKTSSYSSSWTKDESSWIRTESSSVQNAYETYLVEDMGSKEISLAAQQDMDATKCGQGRSGLDLPEKVEEIVIEDGDEIDPKVVSYKDEFVEICKATVKDGNEKEINIMEHKEVRTYPKADSGEKSRKMEATVSTRDGFLDLRYQGVHQVLTFAPDYPILLRCPSCYATELTLVEMREKWGVDWYFVVIPIPVKQRLLYHRCRKCSYHISPAVSYLKPLEENKQVD